MAPSKSHLTLLLAVVLIAATPQPSAAVREAPAPSTSNDPVAKTSAWCIPCFSFLPQLFCIPPVFCPPTPSAPPPAATASEAGAERVSTIVDGVDAMQGLPHQQNCAGASKARQVLRWPQVTLQERRRLHMPHIGRRRPRQAHVGTPRWRKIPSSVGYM
ncbi:hypothetical protein CFC21_016262 [Triticum aestivum]|uniref:Uncharacterized protein n=2 Tax=Triticum aestivum TaxID=4565 RepID=A0A9R1J0Z7_WHEAT|nr:hypothetical protein CFC21_016262 [Triticum aestivum]